MLNDKVLNWLNKTGFPLEMETAAAFRSAGFDIRQSYIYPDPQSNKGREIDVLASDPDLIGVIDINFVIECKSSSKPWVILTSEDTSRNLLFAFAVTSKSAIDALANKWPNLGELKQYIKKSTHAGYGFRQAFNENNDSAYHASLEVMNACKGIIKEESGHKINHLSFAFPVIVIDSPLFECQLENNGGLSIKEVESGEFQFSAHLPNYVSTCIKVIKKEKLNSFAQQAKKLSDILRAELKSHEDKIFSRADNT